MKRDKLRTTRITHSLDKFWNKHPELRLGQIVAILIEEANKYDVDYYFIEDWFWEEALEKLNKEQI